MDDIHRKSTCLPDYDDTLAGGYFATVVAFQREMSFGEVVAGQVILNTPGRIVKE